MEMTAKDDRQKIWMYMSKASHKENEIIIN